MPRSTKSRGVQDEAPGGVAILDNEEITDEMTSATDADAELDEELDDPTFEFTSEPAPKDFTPDRKTPGRVRRPSYFDNVLRDPDVFNTGRWQKVPVSGPEHLEAAKRELNRSKLHLNKIGLETGEPEIGLDLDERDDALYFRSRTAQKRERKNGNTSDAADVADEGADEEYEDDAE